MPETVTVVAMDDRKDFHLPFRRALTVKAPNLVDRLIQCYSVEETCSALSGVRRDEFCILVLDQHVPVAADAFKTVAHLEAERAALCESLMDSKGVANSVAAASKEEIDRIDREIAGCTCCDGGSRVLDYVEPLSPRWRVIWCDFELRCDHKLASDPRLVVAWKDVDALIETIKRFAEQGHDS